VAAGAGWDDPARPAALPDPDLVVGCPVALYPVQQYRADVAVAVPLADRLHRHPGVDQFGGE